MYQTTPATSDCRSAIWVIAYRLSGPIVFLVLVWASGSQHAFARSSAEVDVHGDCLLPSQLRQLSSQFTYLAPRRKIKSTQRDCQVRGGEFVLQTSDHTPSTASVGKRNPMEEGVNLAEIQQALHELGYRPGPVDGLYGSRTRRAIEAFQRDFGLPQDGLPSPTLLRGLRQRLGD